MAGEQEGSKASLPVLGSQIPAINAVANISPAAIVSLKLLPKFRELGAQIGDFDAEGGGFGFEFREAGVFGPHGEGSGFERRSRG